MRNRGGTRSNKGEKSKDSFASGALSSATGTSRNTVGLRGLGHFARDVAQGQTRSARAAALSLLLLLNTVLPPAVVMRVSATTWYQIDVDSNSNEEFCEGMEDWDCGKHNSNP